MKIISKIKEFVIRLKNMRVAKRYYDYDRNIFMKYSACMGIFNQKQLLANITAREHVLEKGFTMPEMRKGFGKDNLIGLIDKCMEYHARGYDTNNPLYIHAIKNIKYYKELHDNLGFELDIQICDCINNIDRTFPDIPAEHQEEYTRTEFFSHHTAGFKEFALSRRTCRNYVGEIEMGLLLQAIDLAKTAPSACNRQPVRVKVVSDKSTQRKILSLQRGNRGFGDKSNKLIIVTSDVSVYNGIFERNCAYVDGGIFLMNLLYSLHYYQIASCTLNWSATDNEDKELRKIIPIPESEVVVGILTCGIPPNTFKIAKSQRLDTESIIKVF